MINKFTSKRCLLLLIVLSLTGCQINKHTTHPNPNDQIAEGPTKSADSEIDPEEEEEAEEDKGPEYQAGAHHVDRATDLASNPAVFGKFKGKATRQIKRFYTVDNHACRGHLEAMPALIFDNPGPSEQYKITAQGDIDVLFIEFSDREIICQRRGQNGQDPVIELPNTRGRAYSVYGGRSKKHATTDFTLTFENPGQPLSVTWLDADIPTLKIDSDVTTPRFLTINPAATQTEERSPKYGNDSCSPTPGHFDYALVPAARIELQQPAVITAGIRSSHPVHMTLLGPIPDDLRDIPTRCLPSNTETLELEAGTYYMRLGLPTDAAANNEPVQFFVHGAAAALDPLTRFENTPENLSVAARALSLHYPFLTPKLLLTNDAIKHQLFVTAPASLYVVATEDISPAQSASVFHGEKGPEDTLLDDARSAEFPKKDELLLLVNGENLVLAADGSLFVIPKQYLSPAERADVVTLPTNARNSQTYFRQALLLADDSDQGIREQYTQRQERYQQCVTKNTSATHTADSDHVKKACGYTRLTDENRRLWRQLEDSRTQRRNDALNIVRTRLADLVLVK